MQNVINLKEFRKNILNDVYKRFLHLIDESCFKMFPSIIGTLRV